MKIKMMGTEWKEIGVLSGITTFSLNQKLGQGTVFESSSGIKVFLSKEDMDILTGADDSPRKLF